MLSRHEVLLLRNSEDFIFEKSNDVAGLVVNVLSEFASIEYHGYSLPLRAKMKDSLSGIWDYLNPKLNVLEVSFNN